MKGFLVTFSFFIATVELARADRQAQKRIPSTAPSAEQQLIRLEQELAEAFVKSDISTVERIEADDINTTQDDGTVTTKQQDIANIRSGDMKIESFDEFDLRVRVYLNTAVVTGQYKEKGTNKGKKFNSTDRFTDVWLNQHGRWQLVFSQDTLVARPK